VDSWKSRNPKIFNKTKSIGPGILGGRRPLVILIQPSFIVSTQGTFPSLRCKLPRLQVHLTECPSIVRGAC
jgi:hypothetical protein